MNVQAFNFEGGKYPFTPLPWTFMNVYLYFKFFWLFLLKYIFLWVLKYIHYLLLLRTNEKLIGFFFILLLSLHNINFNESRFCQGGEETLGRLLH